MFQLLGFYYQDCMGPCDPCPLKPRYAMDPNLGFNSRRVPGRSWYLHNACVEVDSHLPITIRVPLYYDKFARVLGPLCRETCSYKAFGARACERALDRGLPRNDARVISSK